MTLAELAEKLRDGLPKPLPAWVPTHRARPRWYSLAIPGLDATTTTIRVVHAEYLFPGDILRLDAEHVEVVDIDDTDATLAADELAVRRGAEGTTPAAHAGRLRGQVELLRNSRCGGELGQA